MGNKEKGSALAFLQAILWSLLPVLAIYGYKSVDSTFTLAVVTTLGALFFAFVLSTSGSWSDLLQTKAYPYILGNTFFNAFLYIGFLFWGTSLTSAGNVAIILRMETLFAIVFLGLSGFDKISRREVFGGLLMILGAGIVLFPGSLELRIGDLIILFASCLPVFGNVCAKKAREHVSSSAILFLRTLLSAPIFWGIAYYNGSIPTAALSTETMLVLFVNGFFVMGLSRVMWVEAIHLIPVSTANSISSIAPLSTLFFVYLILGKEPSFWQLIAVVPMIIGLNLLIRRKEGLKKSF